MWKRHIITNGVFPSYYACTGTVTFGGFGYYLGLFYYGNNKWFGSAIQLLTGDNCLITCYQSTITIGRWNNV